MSRSPRNSASPFAPATRRRAGTPRGARRGSRLAHQGFAFVTAIFLLVVLASFAAFVVGIASNAAAAGAAAIQGARAYEAARAGLQWASHQVRDPNGTLAPGATNLADCFPSPRVLALPGDLAQFTVTLTCTRTPAIGATPSFHEEGDKRIALYAIFATASFGAPGSTDYVERRIETRIEKCKDPAAPGPTYAC